MRVPVVVPDLRIGTEPLVIGAWLVDEGDEVIVGDQVVEVFIPGVSLDILAVSSGRLVQIMKPVDSSISVGEIIGWLDDATAEMETSGIT